MHNSYSENSQFIKNTIVCQDQIIVLLLVYSNLCQG